MNQELFSYNIKEAISSLDLSREFLVCGTLEEKVHIWRNPQLNSKQYARLDGHLMGVVDVKIDMDETKVVASCLDSYVRVWELEEPSPCTEIKCDPYENWKLQFLDSSNIVLSGEAGYVATYNIETQDRIAQVETDKVYYMTALQVHQRDYGSQLICAGNEQGTIFIINNQKVQHKMRVHGKSIKDICFLGQNEFLTGSDDGLIKLVDMDKLQTQIYFAGHQYGVTGIDVHPENPNIFVSCAVDRTIRFWDRHQKYSTRVITCLQDKPESINGVKFTKDGKYICVAHQCGIIAFYSV